VEKIVELHRNDDKNVRNNYQYDQSIIYNDNMRDLDATDRNLIAALKLDGRASVTTLAGQLGVSRVTVQTRLNKLVSNGAIKRFTIELGRDTSISPITAVMMIELQGALGRAVTRKLHSMPELTELHTTNGNWDLVAHIETTSLPEFDRILREVREIPGVVNSETCLLLDQARI
jgi:DNA-binding Lrp family transcriptional regulator